MKRLAGCLVVSLLASAAVWAGCRDDLGDESQFVVIGPGTDAGGDAYGGSTIIDAKTVIIIDAPTEGPVPDAGSGGVIDAPAEGPVPDAGSGSVIDAPAEGPVPDAGGGMPDDGGVLGGAVDASGTGDALRTSDNDSLNRTSFYACTGGPASTGIEVGLPIGLALAFAVRRRRRWRAPGAES